MSILVLDNESGLPYTKVRQVTHIIPLCDKIDHIPDSFCNCKYSITKNGDDLIFRHTPLDDREILENATGIGVKGKGWLIVIQTTQDNLKTQPQPETGNAN